LSFIISYFQFGELEDRRLGYVKGRSKEVEKVSGSEDQAPSFYGVFRL